MNQKRVCVLLVLVSTFVSSVYSLSAQVQSLGALPIKWSPDARQVAIPMGKTVELWAVLKHERSSVLLGHTENVSMVAWSPDSKQIATSSFDQTVRVWDSLQGQLKLVLPHPDNPVVSVIWSPDSSKIISTKFDVSPALTVWDAQHGVPLSSHIAGTVEDFKFSPNGRFLAYSASLALVVLDSTSYARLARYGAVCCGNQMQVLAWSPDSSKIVTGSLNGLVTIWEAATLQMLHQFTANPYSKPDARDIDNIALSWVRDVTFSPDGKSVLAISGDGTLREWDVLSGTLQQESQVAPLATATFSPYTGRLVYLDMAMLPSLQGRDTSPSLDAGLHIIVPNPSLEKLNALAARCVQDGNSASPAVRSLITTPTTTETVSDLVSRVRALPKDAIPPACAADLLAISEALSAR